MKIAILASILAAVIYVGLVALCCRRGDKPENFNDK
jgi:hypothetical protein